jgi:protein-tyrosine phosphatase
VQADLAAHFEKCLQFIRGAVRSGGSVLVHCAMGVSRSATIVTAFVMWWLRLPFEPALKFVQKCRPFACPNDGFRRQLQEFQKTIEAPATHVMP